MLRTGIGYMPLEKLQRLAEIYAKIDRATSNSFRREVTEEEWQPVEFSKLINLDEIKEACELIDKYFKYTGGSKTFIHLGDLFADRGVCDEIMLALLNAIKKQAGEELIILASNHGTFLEDLGYEYHGDDDYKDAEYYMQTRSARVGLVCNPDYIRKLGEFLENNTQLFHFDKRTNTFFTHCPITRTNLEEFVRKANQVIENPGQYGLDRNKFNFRPLEIPQNNDPEEISKFVEHANQYYKAVMSWFFEGCQDFKGFDSKRGTLPVQSLIAVVGTEIRFSDYGVRLDKDKKPFNVTMVHGHEGTGFYNKIDNEVYNLNGTGGKSPAFVDVGYLPFINKQKSQDLYIALF